MDRAKALLWPFLPAMNVFSHIFINSAYLALKNVMENLPTRTIHGSKPAVLSYTKQSLARLEESSAKTQTRPDIKKKVRNYRFSGTAPVKSSNFLMNLLFYGVRDYKMEANRHEVVVILVLRVILTILI